MKKFASLKKQLAAGLMMSCCGLIQAGGLTEIGRYATVENKPLPAQVNPLLAVQQIHFNTEILTVGDAMNHWLQFSGYSLVDEKERSEALKTVLLKPLPQVDRNLGPLSVREGLEVLVGKDIFNLQVDPLNRRVSFKLSPRYAQFTKKSGARA